MESSSCKPKCRLPTKAECEKALGDLTSLPTRLSIAFDSVPESCFTRKKLFSGSENNTYEWIFQHETPQQTLKEYHEDGPNQVYSNQSKIYIKPQDASCNEYFLQCCRNYAKAFFHGMHVVLLPAGDWKNLDIKVYEKSYGIQLDSSDIMEKTFYKMPADTYTFMNIVKDDLSRKGFGYVIGVSNFKSRTGVFSTARYDPDWQKEEDEDDYDEDEKLDFEGMASKQKEFNLLLFRSLKVLCHKIAHTFCLPHCPYYECLMNGSNTIIEGRRKPMYLCPVCLRKIQSIIGFDVIERYEKIIDAIEDLENPYFESTLEWYKQRLKQLQERAIQCNCVKPYRVKHEEKPVPKPKVVRTVIKKKKPGKPGIMQEGTTKVREETKKMTAIQRLIWEKKNKAK